MHEAFTGSQSARGGREAPVHHSLCAIHLAARTLLPPQSVLASIDVGNVSRLDLGFVSISLTASVLQS
jgi:hypothetical protein